MNKNLVISFATIALGVLLATAPTRGADAIAKFASLTGNVVLLGIGDDLLSTTEDKPEQINVGGLVVVQIHDLGSAPVEIVSVASGDRFEQIGELRGGGVKEGRRLMGGGYKWLLFRAGDKLGAAKITIAYKSAPHAGGETKEEVQYLEIVAIE